MPNNRENEKHKNVPETLANLLCKMGRQIFHFSQNWIWTLSSIFFTGSYCVVKKYNIPLFLPNFIKTRSRSYYFDLFH